MILGFPKKLQNGNWGAFTKSEAQAGDLIVLQSRGGKRWISVVSACASSDDKEGFVLELRDERVRYVNVEITYSGNEGTSISTSRESIYKAVELWQAWRQWDGHPATQPVKRNSTGTASKVVYSL